MTTPVEFREMLCGPVVAMTTPFKSDLSDAGGIERGPRRAVGLYLSARNCASLGVSRVRVILKLPAGPQGCPV